MSGPESSAKPPGQPGYSAFISYATRGRPRDGVQNRRAPRSPRAEMLDRAAQRPRGQAICRRDRARHRHVAELHPCAVASFEQLEIRAARGRAGGPQGQADLRGAYRGGRPVGRPAALPLGNPLDRRVERRSRRARQTTRGDCCARRTEDEEASPRPKVEARTPKTERSARLRPRSPHPKPLKQALRVEREPERRERRRAAYHEPRRQVTALCRARRTCARHRRGLDLGRPISGHG